MNQTVKIKLPSDTQCYKAIRNTLLISSINGSIGYFIGSICLAIIWRVTFIEKAMGNLLFEAMGMVVFGLLVSSIYTIVKYVLDARELNRKDSEYIRLLYIKLVENRVIKPQLA